MLGFKKKANIHKNIYLISKFVPDSTMCFEPPNQSIAVNENLQTNVNINLQIVKLNFYL